MKTEKTVGIVGAGPAGLYAASLLSKKGFKVLIWEKEEYIGGRTKMRKIGDRSVVGGAGVVRNQDSLLQNSAKGLLNPFLSSYHIQFPLTNSENLNSWVKKLEKDLVHMDRSLDFKTNMIRLYGKKKFEEFVQWVGYTDFCKADVKDTIQDYHFEDCLPGQTMYGIDWDKWTQRLLSSLSVSVKVFLNSPIEKIKKTESGFLVKSNSSSSPHFVNLLVWTAPRNTWSLLNPLFSTKKKKDLWKEIKAGVQCQPFLRLYAYPKDKVCARHLYPKHTLLPFKNPLGKIIPYGKDLYMMSYSDNQRALQVVKNYKNPDWLFEWSGIRWKKPTLFYFSCGTHYFTPLSSSFSSRKEFLKIAQNPIPGLFLAGEGVSQNQGWTEGALESVKAIIDKIN
jgi:hypothetical protein